MNSHGNQISQIYYYTVSFVTQNVKVSAKRTVAILKLTIFLLVIGVLSFGNRKKFFQVKKWLILLKSLDIIQLNTYQRFMAHMIQPVTMAKVNICSFKIKTCCS